MQFRRPSLLKRGEGESKYPQKLSKLQVYFCSEIHTEAKRALTERIRSPTSLKVRNSIVKRVGRYLLLSFSFEHLTKFITFHKGGDCLEKKVSHLAQGHSGKVAYYSSN